MNMPDNIVLPRRLWSELVQWRSGYCCEGCGRDRQVLKAEGMSGRLGAHHIDHDKENNRLDNGRCLCPTCHIKVHRKDYSNACVPGCTCKRHRRNASVYHGSRPCLPGCECARHQPPANPFTGGSSPCPPECSCAKHSATYKGPRAQERQCSECPRVTTRITRDRCPACYAKLLRTEGRVGKRSGASCG